MISVLGTYLPPWDGGSGRRACGDDEDAVTLAVDAGRAALAAIAPASVVDVVIVSRELPLLEGGNAAALLGGLGLDRSTDVVERLGGGPATLDALVSSGARTLVIGVDVSDGAGASAAVVGDVGADLRPAGRVHRSLPLTARWADGSVFEDADPRLQRERGLRASLALAELAGKPNLLTGVSSREAAAFVEGPPITLPTSGASAPLFGLAALAETSSPGLVAAVEQATLAAVSWDPAGVRIVRNEQEPRAVAQRLRSPGPEIKLAFTAYERAFDAKVRWEAGRCPVCATLAFPPRRRCLACGAEGSAELVPLPRTGTVYTTTTIHVPVPALATPYDLAVVELDDVGVRALVGVTDVPPGSIDIGTRGHLLFRRVAVRAGVPDYGYAFSPELVS
jgi:uncharacterized OB-fold protein